MNISNAIYAAPLLPLKPPPTPRPLSCKFHVSTKLDSVPSWPYYGAGADKSRQQEAPQSLQLYEELKGTWKPHTLEAAFFFSVQLMRISQQFST